MAFRRFAAVHVDGHQQHDRPDPLPAKRQNISDAVRKVLAGLPVKVLVFQGLIDSLQEFFGS